MKYYYYYILIKIHFKKGARKMKSFWKMFVIGFIITFTVVGVFVKTYENNSIMVQQYIEDNENADTEKC